MASIDDLYGVTGNPREGAASYVRSIFDREMGVTLHNAKVGSPRDDAMRELTNATANLYARRVLRELIQNAFDGAAAAGAARILVRLDLREGKHGTLYVANSGVGFTQENVDAISNPALSNKRPGNFIGHKGLGFRSVELLSRDTQIYSVAGVEHGQSVFDGFCFRFADHDDERAWLDAADEAKFNDVVIGRTHRLQLPIPIDEDPPEILDLAGRGFATVVRLPLRDALATVRAQDEMRLLIDEKAPLTLFLDQMSSLQLETVGYDGDLASKMLSRATRDRKVTGRGRGLVTEQVTVDKRRFVVASMPVDDAGFRASVRASVDQRHPVAKWLDWMGIPSVSIAIPLSADARTGSYYAFLPMDTEAPFNGCLDAPFFPDADRRDLDLSIPLNAFLIDSVADVCLALADEITDANQTALESVCVAVDAISWGRDPQRMIEACRRAGRDVGALKLPTVRRRVENSRWAAFDEIFDWDDSGCGAIDVKWLVRSCGVPMLRRGIGDIRRASVHTMIEATEFHLKPSLDRWVEWVPVLAADLNARKRVPKETWERFYADLAVMNGVLPRLHGARIFRVSEGVLAPANSTETLGQREFFISPDSEGSGSRRRLKGTALFPPASVVKRMEFADPSLQWTPTVAKAMFTAGLATEYGLAKVVGRLGRLLGSRPNRAVRLAALRWAFQAWLAHKSPELEKALPTCGLQVPVAGGGFKSTNLVRFGRGWRDTRGDLTAEFCESAADASKDVRAIMDGLLPSWDVWPLRERGTSGEWHAFLKLIGVRDGLSVIYHKEQVHNVWTWRGMKSGLGDTLPVENQVGQSWRRAVASGPTTNFGYQSGSYSTSTTLFAFALQTVHSDLPPRAKLSFARLIMDAVARVNEKHLTTELRRTTGYSDYVRWPSPLLAFLREEEWVPVTANDGVRWARPRECWYSSRTDPMPRLVPRIDRSVREVLEGSSHARDIFVNHLKLRLWNDAASSIARLDLLGGLLATGVAESEHDGVRSGVRDAWKGWHDLDPRPPLPSAMSLAVQSSGRLASLLVEKDVEHPTVFVGEGEDPALENLLVSLGHRLVPVPPETGASIVNALSAAIGGTFVLASMARPAILIDGVPFDPSDQYDRLAGHGREWLAEIAVLALEFNRGFSNRATVRTRQQLLDAFRRLRVVVGQHVQVEIEERVGDLPVELDGVLPVPHAEHPTLVLQNSSSQFDWALLARISRGISAAVERPWLDTDMRVAFLELANLQNGRPLERPSDEAIARAFGQPAERVREIVRSLRSSGRRLFDLLAPVVFVRCGGQPAHDLVEREHQLVDDADLLKALVGFGLSMDESQSLVVRCREADDLDDLRRSMGIDLRGINVALTGLGPPWVPLNFEAKLRQTFDARLDERRADIEQIVRNAYLAVFDAKASLADYVEERRLLAIAFNEAWSGERDELDNVTIDAWIDVLANARWKPSVDVHLLSAVEATRQHNRVLLTEMVEGARKVLLAWAAKDPANRIVPLDWRTRSELVVRAAMASGALDFRLLEGSDVPDALSRAGLWPPGMPRTLALAGLGLVAEDLEIQALETKKIQEAELKRKRSVTVGSVEIDGGAEGAFQQMAAALEAALCGREFQTRSGPAVLREFPDGDHFPKRRSSGPGGGSDPQYMSDERRTLIGFAGELAAYHYLRRKVRGFADEHWLSSMGRRYLALPAMKDDDGFDFKVPRTRGPLMWEVKAHEGDPGLVELERSQVAAAVAHADGKKGTWVILYVANATDPTRVSVHELPNPFSADGLNRFRPSTRQGVRLLIERE